MYRAIIRPLLFLFSPESIHGLVKKLLLLSHRIPGISFIIRSVYSIKTNSDFDLLGLKFPNRVGLAAGFDKDASFYNELSAFGFGFIEIGTVTPIGQPGNPKPRSFRLPIDKALINRMGFNNLGVEEAVKKGYK